MLRVVNLLKTSFISLTIYHVCHDIFRTYFAKQKNDRFEFDIEKKRNKIIVSSNILNIENQQINRENKTNFTIVEIANIEINKFFEMNDNNDYKLNDENQTIFEKI